MENENSERGISLFDILHALWKNVILICIVTLLVTILGIVYTFAGVTPTYRSSANLLVAVSPNSTSSKEGSIDYSNSLKVVQTIGKLVEEDCVLDGVAEKHPDLTIGKLRGMVSVSVSNDTYIITVIVVSSNKQLTKIIADEVAAELISECDPEDGNEAIKVLQVTINQTSQASAPVYNSPNKKLYVIVSFLGGAVLALVIVFLKEFMSNKFKNKEEVEDLLGVKVVGTFVENKDRAKNQDLALIESNNVYQLEEYNSLLSNIKYANIENPYKVIAITSSTEDELKTTTVCNLAVSMVANGKKVVIIDLDIKRPTIHKVFKVQRTDGLVEYIDDILSYEKVIKHTDRNIDIITAGPAVLNSLVILESEHLKELINKLKEDYDYVLLDTTPLSVSSDSAIAGKLADGILYNVSINQAKKKLVKEHLVLLKNLGVNIIGINVNKIPKSAKSGYYYYYSSYHEKVDNTPKPSNQSLADSLDTSASNESDINSKSDSEEL